MDDWSLLSAYARDGDEGAFATLVERHIGLVYGAAYRQLRNAAAAEEIVQGVFTTLAEKAGSLKKSGALAAWLYRASCRRAIDQLRQESARRRREHQHAEAMTNEMTGEETDNANWREIAPLLEEAMNSLKEQDRTAVLMRVFEQRPLAEVGTALGVSDDTARKRVDAALERLRRWFERRGVRCTSAAMGVTLGTFAAAPTASSFLQSTIQSALTHAATTATATTSTSTILTTMASMKLPLALGLLVGTAVPISLGYLDQRKLHAASDTNSHHPLKELSVPKPALSGLMAEWVKLRADYGPNGGTMAQLYDVVADLDDAFRRRTFRTALVAEWATTDPEEALTYFQAAQDSRRMTDVMRVWLENDPSEAISLLKANGKDLEGVISDVLTDIAKEHPRELAELATLSSENRVARAFAAAARNNLTAMREAALTMEGRARIEALGGVAEAWAERDPSAALDWVQSLDSSQDRSRALRHLLVGWASSDPVAALEHVEIAPPGGVGMHEHSTAEAVLGVAAKTDFETTLAWLAENPDKFTDKQISGLNNPLQERLVADVSGTLAMIRDHGAQPLLLKTLERLLMNEAAGRREDVWNWARAEPPSAFTSNLKRELARHFMTEDSDNAITLARALIADGDLEAISLPLLANIVVKHPSDMVRYDDVFQYAPQDVRDDAIMWALTRDGGPDLSHEDWLGWVDQLPNEKRARSVMKRAADLVSADPDNAIRWANSLPEADQPKAYEGLTMRWSKADSYETSQWIATLPPGAARDSATVALVNAVSASEPDSGWEWAQTILEPTQREQALQSVLQHFGVSAASVVENSDLSPEETARLHAWIANHQIKNNP